MVIAANADVVEDPNLIYVGEQFDFPSIGTPPPPPPPEPPPEAAPAQPAAATVPVVDPTPIHEAADGAAPTASTTTTTTPPPTAPVEPAAVGAGATVAASPSPIGLGEAAMLSAGVLALLASRRRLRLRASRPRARVPEPSAELVAAERRLRVIDPSERLLRVDVAVRAAAASLVDTSVQITVVCVAIDGTVELALTGDAVLPAPWEGNGEAWVLPGSTPVELLADAARSVGAPCVALTQLGVDAGGREVLVDLEALGVLSVAAPDGRRRRRGPRHRGDVGDVGVRRGGQPRRCRDRRRRVPRPPAGPRRAARSTVPSNWRRRSSGRRQRPGRARSCYAPGTRAVRRGSRRSCSRARRWRARSRLRSCGRRPDGMVASPSSSQVTRPMRRGRCAPRMAGGCSPRTA